MEKTKPVVMPRKNFLKIVGQLLYTEEQLKAFQQELDASPFKEDHHSWWLGYQLKIGELSSFVIYTKKNVSDEEIIQEALEKCAMARKEEYKTKLNIQSKEEMWFEDLPYEIQKKFGVCYKTTLSYLPDGIKCWKRWGRRSYDMLVPTDMPLDRGRRVQWERDEYFENWQLAKDIFFGNESETLRLRKEAIAQEKAALRLAEEQKASAVYQAHQAEIDAYNEKYRLFRGETKEEYAEHPIFDALYIRSYYPPVLYTEELLKGSMHFIDEQIKEKEQKEAAEKNRQMWQEKLELALNNKLENGEKSLMERVQALDYRFLYGSEDVDIYQGDNRCETIRYSDETVFLINQFITQKELEIKKQQEREHQRIEYKKERDEAKALGLPADIKVWHCTGGSSNCGEGWVIKEDGSFREPTSFEAVKRYGDGYKNWEQILEGEVVLSWAKSCTTAEHEFKVIHMPKTGLTAAQKEVILKIEEDIQEEWKNKRGLSSGIPSPDVGMGWNICGRKKPLRFNEDGPQHHAQKESAEATVKPNDKPAHEATLDDMLRLKEFFNNR